MYEADSVWHQVVMANSFGEEGRGLMQQSHSTVSSDCEVMSVYVCM